MTCPFCQLIAAADPRCIARFGGVISMQDLYPVSVGHTLVIPVEHLATYWGAPAATQLALWAAVARVKAELDFGYAPDGYNVGFNAGTAAGQTVQHLHIHVIPRYFGDVDDPRGGVRGCIPARQRYEP